MLEKIKALANGTAKNNIATFESYSGIIQTVVTVYVPVYNQNKFVLTVENSWGDRIPQKNFANAEQVLNALNELLGKSFNQI